MDFFNKTDNGIMLPKRSVELDINGHTVHNDYNREISKKISEICNKPNIDDLEKFDDIKELIQTTKSKLKSDVLFGDKNVNDIRNF